jgi:hypothetical protein
VWMNAWMLSWRSPTKAMRSGSGVVFTGVEGKGRDGCGLVSCVRFCAGGRENGSLLHLYA